MDIMDFGPNPIKKKPKYLEFNYLYNILVRKNTLYVEDSWVASYFS
jgi:hypothetical protein